MRTNGTKSQALRWTLAPASWGRVIYMIVHLMLIIAIIVEGTVEVSSATLLALSILSLVIYLIYVPAAGYLTARHRHTSWDTAWREIGYLVIQNMIWLVLAILSSLTLGSHICDTNNAWYTGNTIGYYFDHFLPHDFEEWCIDVKIVCGLSWCHAAILAIWLCWEGIVINQAIEYATIPTSTDPHARTTRTLSEDTMITAVNTRLDEPTGIWTEDRADVEAQRNAKEGPLRSTTGLSAREKIQRQRRIQPSLKERRRMVWRSSMAELMANRESIKAEALRDE